MKKFSKTNGQVHPENLFMIRTIVTQGCPKRESPNLVKNGREGLQRGSEVPLQKLWRLWHFAGTVRLFDKGSGAGERVGVRAAEIA